MDYFPNNILDKDFQNVLYPLNVMSQIFFMPRYILKENFITPTNYILLCVSCIGILFYIAAQLYYLTWSKFSVISANLMPLVLHIELVFNSISFILNLIPNFYFSINVVKILINIQKSHKAFLFVEDKSFKNVSWRIRMYVFLVFVLCTMSITSHYVYNNIVWDASYFFFILSLSFFDVNIVYITCVLKLINNEMQLWIVEVELFYERISAKNISLKIKESGERKAENRIPDSETSQRIQPKSFSDDRELADSIYDKESERHWNTLFATYLDIIEAFDIYKKVFQLPVLLQTIDTFVHSLLYLHIALEFKDMTVLQDTKFIGPMEMLIVLFLVLKKEIFLIILSFEHECFYKSISIANKLSATICASEMPVSVEMIRLCKMVRRTNRSVVHKMSACGVFLVDAVLPLHLAGVVVNYTVVLLQFAIQKYQEPRENIN